MNKKQLVDQLLHFKAGFFGTIILSFIMPLFLAGAAVCVIGYGREINQRLANGDKWYNCGKGCMLDLLIWYFGVILGLVTVIVFL